MCVDTVCGHCDEYKCGKQLFTFVLLWCYPKRKTKLYYCEMLNIVFSAGDAGGSLTTQHCVNNAHLSKFFSLSLELYAETKYDTVKLYKRKFEYTHK